MPRFSIPKRYSDKRTSPRLLICFLILGLTCFLTNFISTPAIGQELPQSWRGEWQNPSNAMRPLQMLHGSDLTKMKTVEYYRDQCGLGGMVVNVGGPEYIRKDENWKKFVEGVKNIRQAGLRVWIYDELGYPSLSAGGVVLEKDPSLVSLEMVYDKDAQTAKDRFTVRESYEFTHSSNSYSEARKYPNPLNPQATKVFIDVTHRRYRTELGPDLYKQVEAFFTDEPSLMAINLGQIPEESRKKVRTKDPLDPNKKMLPAVPWVQGLENLYQKKYGEDLTQYYGSLFYGDSEKDRAVRKNFWRLIEDLDSNLFYGQIRRFCQEVPQGPIASGHTLHEESILHHVPMDGNKLTALQEFDLPGLDILTSMPGAHFYGAWKTAAFPVSAAVLNGSRKIMSETSDHGERLYGRKRMADLNEMTGTAAWQIAWGVTEFTLYYGIRGEANSPYRNEKCHHDYCDFIGRCNAVLRSADYLRPVILYYPIEIVQEEYLPTAEKMSLNSQSLRMRKTCQSFYSLGAALCRAQIPFILADEKRIEQIIANSSSDKSGNKTKTGYTSRTTARCDQFSGIIYPEGVVRKNFNWKYGKLPEIYAVPGDRLDQWKIMREKTASFAGPRLIFSGYGSENIAFGSFIRDGKLIFILSNSEPKEFKGTAEFAAPQSMSYDKEKGSFRFDGRGEGANELVKFQSGTWTVLHPENGAVSSLTPDGSTFPIQLAPRQTILLVSP